MTDIWPTIHAERQALADDLASLTADQWQTPSLCDAWTVHDVLAHLTSAAKMTPPKFLSRFAAAGFNFDKFAARQVAVEGSGGPASTLAAFRAAQSRTSAPPGPKDTWLGEAFVHGEDIRRPLGIESAYPPDAVVAALTYQAKAGTAMGGGRELVAGLRLIATDVDFEVGDGAELRGRAIDLLLTAAGRDVRNLS